jgi:hypothetical protein
VEWTTELLLEHHAQLVASAIDLGVAAERRYRSATTKASALAAGTFRAVAGLALDACALRAAELAAARHLFGHRVHLLVGGQPAGTVPDVPALRPWRGEQPYVERLQLLVESLEFGDSRSGARDLVGDHVPEASPLGYDVSTWVGQELADLAQSEAEALGSLDEAERSECLRSVHAVAGLRPQGRAQQPGLIGVPQR